MFSGNPITQANNTGTSSLTVSARVQLTATSGFQLMTHSFTTVANTNSNIPEPGTGALLAAGFAALRKRVTR